MANDFSNIKIPADIIALANGSPNPQRSPQAYKKWQADKKAADLKAQAANIDGSIKSLTVQVAAAYTAMTKAKGALAAAKKGVKYFLLTKVTQSTNVISGYYSAGPGNTVPLNDHKVALVANNGIISKLNGVCQIPTSGINTTTKYVSMGAATSVAELYYDQIAYTAYIGASETALKNIVSTTADALTTEYKWQALKAKLDVAKKSRAKIVLPVVTPPVGSVFGPKGTIVIPPDNSPMEINVPSIKSAYFSIGQFKGNSEKSPFYTTGGSPATATAVKNAQDLWKTAADGAHKGMLQTYRYWKLQTKPSATGADGKVTTDPNLPSWFNNSYQKNQYAFQFLYNPSEVSMDWGGTPNVDPGLLMSGKDATPYIVPSQSASNISFNLILNRMPDIGLINSLKLDNDDTGQTGINGASTNSKEYYGKKVTTEELRQIYELGTMYDLEFLLSTLVGFRMYSEMRGRYTADMGFLLGLPVELHLGKQLRYLGTISYFNVTHTIFGKNMVPLFTNVQIGFARRIEPVNGNSHGINGSLTPIQ